MKSVAAFFGGCRAATSGAETRDVRGAGEGEVGAGCVGVPLAKACEPYKLGISVAYPTNTTVIRSEFIEANGACLIAVHTTIVRTLFILEEFPYELQFTTSIALRPGARPLHVILIPPDYDVV